jgi:hypothetical protein
MRLKQMIPEYLVRFYSAGDQDKWRLDCGQRFYDGNVFPDVWVSGKEVRKIAVVGRRCLDARITKYVTAGCVECAATTATFANRPFRFTNIQHFTPVEVYLPHHPLIARALTESSELSDYLSVFIRDRQRGPFCHEETGDGGRCCRRLLQVCWCVLRRAGSALPQWDGEEVKRGMVPGKPKVYWIWLVRL